MQCLPVLCEKCPLIALVLHTLSADLGVQNAARQLKFGCKALLHRHHEGLLPGQAPGSSNLHQASAELLPPTTKFQTLQLAQMQMYATQSSHSTPPVGCVGCSSMLSVRMHAPAEQVHLQPDVCTFPVLRPIRPAVECNGLVCERTR
jgi:hypothetical protein